MEMGYLTIECPGFTALNTPTYYSVVTHRDLCKYITELQWIRNFLVQIKTS